MDVFMNTLKKSIWSLPSMSTTSVYVLGYQTTLFNTFYFGNTNKMSGKLLTSSGITEKSLRYRKKNSILWTTCIMDNQFCLLFKITLFLSPKTGSIIFNLDDLPTELAW